MTTEQNKAALRRFREAVDAGDVNGAVAAFAPEALVHMPGAPEPLNLDSFSHMFRALLSAFPGVSRPSKILLLKGTRL